MSKDHVTWDNDWLRRIKVFNHLISLMYHCSAWWLTKAKMSILWSALMLIWGDGHFTNIVHKLKGIEIDSAYNSLFLIDSKEVVSVTGNLFLFYLTRKKKRRSVTFVNIRLHFFLLQSLPWSWLIWSASICLHFHILIGCLFQTQLIILISFLTYLQTDYTLIFFCD